MQVTSITVRYERRVKPKDFEGIEAESTLTATFDDEGNEDHTVIGNKLMQDAREIVHNGIKGKIDAAAAGTEATDVKKEPAKRGRKTAAQKKAEAAAAAANNTNTMPDDSDDGDATPAATKDDAGATSDATMPDDDDPASIGLEPAEEEITAQELQQFISKNVASKKVQIKKMKEILGDFKTTEGGSVTRISDVKAEDRAKVKETIEAAAAKSSN